MPVSSAFYVTSEKVQLNFSTPLTEGVYRFSISDFVIHNGYYYLDGDDNGTSGGVYSRDFVVQAAQAPTFSLASTSPFSEGSENPQLADFNNDGKLDVATTNINTGGIRIGLGNGDGSFSYLTEFGFGTTFGLTSGDFTGDGRIDLAATLYGYDGVYIFNGNGDGTFGYWNFLTVADPYNIITADLNNDGRLIFDVIRSLRQ